MTFLVLVLIGFDLCRLGKELFELGVAEQPTRHSITKETGALLFSY